MKTPAAILLAAFLFGCTDIRSADDAAAYSFDKLSIYYLGKAVQTASNKEFIGYLEGPIVFGANVAFVEMETNHVYLFRAGRLIKERRMWNNARWSDFPMRNSTMSVIRTAQGLLLYDAHGKARMLSESLSIRRVRGLDVDPNTDGCPRLISWRNVNVGKVTMTASLQAKDDHYFVIDCDSFRILEKGLLPRPKR